MPRPRRNREIPYRQVTNFDAQDPNSDAIHITIPPPVSETESPKSLIRLQHDAMLAAFAEKGVTLANYALELSSVARAAASQGDFAAAAQLYKILGQNIGALQGESHRHVHLHQAPGVNASEQGDFRATSDDDLRALIATASAKEPEIAPADVIQVHDTPPEPQPTPDAATIQ